MPLTDDDFVKTGKLEGYSEMIQKLHEEEQTQPEITYDLQLEGLCLSEIIKKCKKNDRRFN